MIKVEKSWKKLTKIEKRTKLKKLDNLIKE
jgi:hypothetical protein